MSVSFYRVIADVLLPIGIVFFLKISFFDNYESTVNYNLYYQYVSQNSAKQHKTLISG